MSDGTSGEEVLAGIGPDGLARFMDASPVAMAAFLDGEGIRHVNAPFERLFGYARAEVLEQSYEVLAPPHFRDALVEAVQSFVTQDPPSPQAWRPDFPARRKDGSEFPMQYSAVPLPSDEGLWVVVEIHDVTPLRESEREARAETRRYLTLARLNEVVAGAPDVATLYAETCRIAVEVGGFVSAWVAEGSAGRPLTRVASAGLATQVADQVDQVLAGAMAGSPSPTRRAVQEEQPVFQHDLGDDRTSAWQAWAGDAGFGSVASLPLFRGGRAVAALTLVARNPVDFDDQTRELLTGLARGVSVALDAFEDRERTERLARHRRDLLRRLMDVQESDRGRIAADIHDDSVQALAAIDLRLGMVRRRARDVAPELDPALEQIWTVLGSATSSLRHLLFSLEAPDPGAGLRASLVEASDHVFLDSPVRVEVHCDDAELPELLLGQALRIVKEALANAQRHAHARTVWIDANRVDSGVEIRVRDDGDGLPPGTTDEARPGEPELGVVQRVGGIVAMRERAELSGGRCVVAPGPEGRGTEVVLWLPGRLEEGVPSAYDDGVGREPA